MRIIVLGAAGMLGHKVFQKLRAHYPGTLATMWEDVTQPPLDRVDLLQGADVIPGVDVTDFPRLQRLLADIRPDYIINCVGIVKQRDEAKKAIPSVTINSLLPHMLAQFSAEWGGRVIHPSTDCVFSGRKGAYTEDDASDAEDLYGKSKFLGELSTVDNGLTLRTSIIGRELVTHHSLLDWFLAQQGRTVSGYTRVIYSGVTTNQFAKVVQWLIAHYPSLHGLYQLVASPISKHDLLALFEQAYHVDVEIVPDDSVVSDRSMRGDRFYAATGYVSPSWPHLVEELAQDETPYDQWVGPLHG
jgi:dTDP-4-dehydrorhamnose reductase